MSLSTGNNNNMAVFPSQASVTNLDILKFMSLQGAFKPQAVQQDNFTSLPPFYEPCKKVKREAVSEAFLSQLRYGEGLLGQNSDSVLRRPQYLSGTQQQQPVFVSNQMSNNLNLNLSNSVQSNNQLINSLLLQSKIQEIQKALQQAPFERQQSLQNRNLGMLNCSNPTIQNSSALISMPQLSQINSLFPASGKLLQPSQSLINSETPNMENLILAKNILLASSLSNDVNVKRRRERSSSPEGHQQQQQESSVFDKKVKVEAKSNIKCNDKILDMESSSTSSKTAETTSDSLSPQDQDRHDVKFLAEEFEGLTQFELDDFIANLEKKVSAKVINKKRIAELLSKFNNCTKQILENVRKNKSYYRTQLC